LADKGRIIPLAGRARLSASFQTAINFAL